MNQPDPEEQRIEQLKAQLEFDEKVAEKYGLTKGQVQKDYDPTLVKLISEFLRHRRR
jgi:hypothetical protein